MLLLIDSRDRLAGSNSSSDFNIRLQNTIQQVSTVKLVNVWINHQVYNVSAEYNNNTFTFNEGGDSISFNIADGFYTREQLATHVETGLNAETGLALVYSVSYSSTAFKYTITSTGNFIIDDCTLGNLMGMTVTQTPGTSQVSDSVTLLNDPQYLLLDISAFAMTTTTSNSISTTFVLSNDDETSEYHGIPNQCLSFTQPVDVSLFRVFLKNRDGSNVDLNGTNFAFLLNIQ